MAGRIAVIGDIVLDVYHFCTNRDNPESSAPCYKVKNTEYKLGCAGNVASNLKRLGSQCTLISVVGEDEDARKLEDILKFLEIDSILIKDNKRSTIVKERYLSSNDERYHFRADFEKEKYIEQNHMEELISKVKGYSIVVVSDYNKGVISSKLMEEMKKNNEKIIADTKTNHKEYCKGIFLIKPNTKEVREMTGIENELVAAERLGKELQTNVLLTRGKEGVSYFGLEGERHSFKPSIPSEKVIDVTGAGDTVIATFCHFLNKGCHSIEDCVHLANSSGEISVQYPGCYQVSEKDLVGTLSCTGL